AIATIPWRRERPALPVVCLRRPGACGQRVVEPRAGHWQVCTLGRARRVHQADASGQKSYGFAEWFGRRQQKPALDSYQNTAFAPELVRCPGDFVSTDSPPRIGSV